MPNTAQTAEAALAALVAENARLAQFENWWYALSNRAEEDDDSYITNLMNDIEFGE